MKKLLGAFSFKTIQEFARILKIILKEDFTSEDFIEFAREEKEESSKDIFKVSYKRENKKNVKLVRAVGRSVAIRSEDHIISKEKPTKNKFIVPGELVKMHGVVCSECGNEVYTTAVCCGNPLKAQGFLRKTICGSCGLEFGQK